jgi:hypothetical protein
MVKNKYIILFSLLLAILSSCTMKEDIQRDLILETTPIDFDIPITTDIVNPVKLAEISTAADLHAMITENTKEFTVSDLKSIQITGFLLEIEGLNTGEGEEGEAPGEPDVTNTFKAFQNIRVQLKKPDESLLDIGVVNNANMQSEGLIQIPIIAGQELKEQLNNNAFTYIITGTANTPTTEIIKARAIVQYKLKLGM